MLGKMTARGRVPKGVAGEGEDSLSTRKKKEDVLNQARAVLRQSQQFRPPPLDKKHNSLSSKLAFQQQTQDDFWSPGGVVVDTTFHHQQQRYPYEGQTKFSKDNDFGLPFRDAMRNSPVTVRRPPQKLAGVQSQLSSSSTTMSIDTTDLKISSDLVSTDSDSDSGRSISSMKIRKSGKDVKIKVEPSTVKLTPLTPRTRTPVPVESQQSKMETQTPEIENNESDKEKQILSPSEKLAISTVSKSTPALGLVEEDELGFSRALLKKSEHDPHWFEKALLVRGESISEAAYKAFKEVQQHQQESEIHVKKSKKRKPIFSNLTDPEYTADWISDAGDDASNSVVEEVADIPESECAEDDLHPEEITITHTLGVDEDEISEMIYTADDDGNTTSLVKTASELETSGVLDEIANNLHSVLEISENPESQGLDSTRMTEEERSFAREYDDALVEDSEPLKSIFNDIFQNPDATVEPATESKADEDTASGSKSLSLSRNKRQDSMSNSNTWIQYEGDDYENTFIQGSTSTSTLKSALKKSSSTRTRIQIANKDGGQPSGIKKGSSSGSLTKSKGKIESTSVSEKQKSGSIATPSSKSKSVGSIEGRSLKTSSVSSSSKRQLPTGEREPHPSSRYQKNIQAILEKEVYQKELKRRRSQKIREERSQERLKLVAKESLDRNKKSVYKDPSYTEILLPELFKYKSVSGLTAAKAKRTAGVTSPMSPPVNFGAPYFNFNGALSSSDQLGSAGMLAAAQVESLDIPDLVREVLASNERMYKMTLEAGKEMAKVYKKKVRAKTATSRHQ